MASRIGEPWMVDQMRSADLVLIQWLSFSFQACPLLWA